MLMEELRCVKCGRLLERVLIGNGYIEIKCPKCKEVNKFRFFNNDFEVEIKENTAE